MTMTLLFWFVAGATLMCHWVLFFLVGPGRARRGVAVGMLLFIAWIFVLFMQPHWLNLPLLWLLPLPGVAITLRYGLPERLLPLPAYNLQAEPMTTQEGMAGRAGTREALRIFFALAAAGLTFLLVVLLSVNWPEIRLFS